MMTLIVSVMLWIAGLPAVVPQPQRGLPPTQRQGAPAPPRTGSTPQRPAVVPLPQVQEPAPESKFICTESLAAERDQIGRLANPVCASIDGVVVRASSNVGIANAHVTLGPPNGGALSEIIETVADSSGRFSFPSINPTLGGYSLIASADGYQPGAYGRVGVNAFGESVSVTNGSHQRFTIKLNPYQTASGTVRTEDNLPVAAALVRAYRVRYSVLGRRMKIVKTGLTTDLGDFRLFGMEPGDYYVSASYSERTRDLPQFGAILTPNLSNPDAGYVTQYYPAGVSPRDAAVSTMVPNAEKTNLNFVLKDTERFKVHVRVFASSTAQSHNFNIALMPEGAELEDASDYAVDGKGSADFEITDVGVGHYSLVAFDKSRILSEPLPITVDHDTEAKITIYDPLDIPGAVVDEGGSAFPGKWSVRLVRTDPEIGQTIRGDVDSGSFVVPDVGPGSYDVYVDGLPQGTYIKEVQFPVNDGPNGKFGRIRIEAERPERILDTNTQKWRSADDLRVVLAKSDLVVVGWASTDPLILHGVSGVQIVLEPERRSENPYAFREDRFIVGSTNSSGFFRWVGVPPGSYTAFAFMEIPPDLYFDSQFNDRISSRGIKGSVTPGLVIPDRIFDMTGCPFPPYVDPIYFNANTAVIPPPDSLCLVPVPRAETVGIAP